MTGINDTHEVILINLFLIQKLFLSFVKFSTRESRVQMTCTKTGNTSPLTSVVGVHQTLVSHETLEVSQCFRSICHSVATFTGRTYKAVEFWLLQRETRRLFLQVI